MNVSSKLKEIRLNKSKSQQEVADYLEITRQAYSHYEVGRRKPDYETLLKLAEFYEVSVLDFLFNAEKEPTANGGQQNLIKIIGRNGSYEERILSDQQIAAVKAILDQLPDASDDL